uniref:transcription factor ORG2-like n=1 Tax=Erigeron canadensis TaxID=72917 RepID=UPI001CB8A556|nr:transcription factor ORG2-like [Erigeron canadensis]
MLALSPPLFSTTFGWPLEDFNTQNLQQTCNDISLEFEANSYHSLLDLPTYDDHQILQHDFSSPDKSNFVSSEGTVNGDIGDTTRKVSKKLNHNASERERRKRVNDLYAFLRSLLPMSSHQKKKVSIPRTVSHALKYIPELQKEVETLARKKEKLSSSSSLTTTNISKGHSGIKVQDAKDVINERKASVSVCVLGDEEAIIHLTSSSTDSMNNNNNEDTSFLSKALEYLEREEDGFVLLNSTSFKSSGDEMLFNTTLHVKVQGDKKIEPEKLKEKLCSFHQY